MPKLVRSLSVLSLIALVACGSETSTIPDPSDGGTSATTTAPGTTLPIANGTCSFTLVDGTTKTRWEGMARPSMNGSGNLRIQCLPKDGGDSRAEVDFGNGSFDGPRTYKGDELTADGNVDLDTGKNNVRYGSNEKGGGCTLVLVEAPLNAFKNEVPRGSRVAGTFSCTAIVSTSKDAAPKTYAVEDGQVAGIVEP